MENSPLRVSFLQPFFNIRVTCFHLDENMLHHYLFKGTGIITYLNMQMVQKTLEWKKYSLFEITCLLRKWQIFIIQGIK